MNRQDPAHKDWSVPLPAKLPRPTWWPAALPMGVTLLFWGIVTSPVVAGAGLLVFIVSLVGWIGEIIHERTETD